MERDPRIAQALIFVSALAGGDVAARLEVDFDEEEDDVNTLLRGLNMLAEELAAAREAEAAAREWLEQRVVERTQQLEARVGELQQRTHDIKTLTEMADLLQACRSTDEAYAIIGETAEALFPHLSGALYVFNASRNLVEAHVQWGEASHHERLFVPDACWALRRGRLHRGRTGSRITCPHLHAAPRPQLCVPLTARGASLGVLTVCGPELVEAEAHERLAIALAEQIALALATLELQATLRFQAIRDPLTGLFNRRYLEETIERELTRAARSGTSVGVVMLDIDHFKRFNDAHGHEAGDTLLRMLGEHLRSVTRCEDLACRYGGEELTLVFPDCSLEEAVRRAEKVRASVARLIVEYRGETLGQVTISAGVAAFPKNGDTPDEVIRAADHALYRAKSEGRNRVVAIGLPDTRAAA